MEKLIFLAESYKKLPIRTIGNEIILETILVEIRAIYLENARYKNNYTIPNFLKEIKQESFYQKIQDYLDKPLIDNVLKKVTNITDEDEIICTDTENSENYSYQNLSIRDSIKFAVDKFIVHHDETNSLYTSYYNRIINALSGYCQPKFEDVYPPTILDIIDFILNTLKEACCAIKKEELEKLINN